jgi:ppGpp synthetase/RelA/SpoT-type nucleotidyltranferase
VSRKSYKSGLEATDLVGIRVITFIETDATAVADLIRKAFKPHPEESLDKSEELGDSQVGYRSIHLICELAPDRVALPEYKPFRGLVFEVQVRTVLQHAWAEIDHDRGYKFSGVLPRELRRRLNLLAGQLESADREFSQLAHDVDLYRDELQRRRAAGDLDVEVSSASLSEYINEIANRHGLRSIKQSEPSKFATVIDELQRFGATTLKDVHQLISEKFLDDLKKMSPETTQVGLLRRAMMYSDIDKYFKKAWQRSWNTMRHSSWVLLSSKWGSQKVASIRKTFLDEKRD